MNKDVEEKEEKSIKSKSSSTTKKGSAVKKNTTDKKTSSPKKSSSAKASSTKKSSTKTSDTKKRKSVKKDAVTKKSVSEKKVSTKKKEIVEGTDPKDQLLEEVVVDDKILEVTQKIPEIKKTTVRRGFLSRFYFGVTERLIVYVLLIVMFTVSGFAFLSKAYDFEDGETINYKENYNLDYNVILKPNDMFDTNVLGKNMTYVASLIDSIDVKYNYRFDIDKESDVKLTYYIYASLSINDGNGKSFLTKDYQLTEPEEVLVDSSKTASISKKINIDYKYYNSLANQFRSTYGISTDSKLTVYLKIMKTNLNKNVTINFVESDPFALEIPLSEKTVNINMNYNAVSENNEVLSKPVYNMVDKRDLIASVCFFVLSLATIAYLFNFLVRIQVKKSEYDKLIEKILREYDRLIVNTTTKPNIHGDRVVKVKDFSELLDVRDTIQLPIMFYEVNKHQKCYFYINQNDILYLLTLKAVDLENK